MRCVNSFAVATLLDWYRAGADVDAQLPALSAYMGHAGPSSTYWYYSDFRVIPIPAPNKRVMGLWPGMTRSGDCRLSG